MKPIKKRLLLTPSKSEMRGGLFIPENVIDNTGTCLVVNVSDDLDIPVRKGDVVICQTTAGNRNSITDGLFLAKQSQIYARISNKAVFPFGKTILIKRDLSSIEVGGIYIPENRRMQSLGGTIHRIGLTRKPFANASIGDYVILKQWESHMIEIQLEDGSYGLIVNDSDLLARVEPNIKVEHQGKVYHNTKQ